MEDERLLSDPENDLLTEAMPLTAHTVDVDEGGIIEKGQYEVEDGP